MGESGGGWNNDLGFWAINWALNVRLLSLTAAAVLTSPRTSLQGITDPVYRSGCAQGPDRGTHHGGVGTGKTVSHEMH